MLGVGYLAFLSQVSYHCPGWRAYNFRSQPFNVYLRVLFVHELRGRDAAEIVIGRIKSKDASPYGETSFMMNDLFIYVIFGSLSLIY